MTSNDLKIVEVNKSNIELLEDFINNLEDASKRFRYFNSRPISVIQNHLSTLILVENKSAIAYGHLDKEDDIVWLGVAVLPKHQGNGYGKRMMLELINYAMYLKINSIKLSVDKVNLQAIKLYEKMGFYLENDNEETCFYKLKIDNGID